MKPWIWGYILLGVFAFIAVGGIAVVVPAGQRAAVFNCFEGVEKRTLSEGTYILIPIVETPFKYEVRTQTYTMSAAEDEGDKRGDDALVALSGDGQKVKVDISVRYHLIPKEVWQLHDQIGPNYVEKIIRPEAQTVVRNVISSYTVTRLYSSSRESIQDQMSEQMKKGMGKYHIALDEVLIRNIGFSDAFANAIEQKQVALQEAERMKYVIQREEAEKQRKIIAATGDAESIRLRAQALKQNPQLIQYEYVQKLAPNIKAVIADQKMLINVGEIFGENK
jgi:regulator of protease activity HflC (stomatin/prohibitin superfamily)